MGIPLVSNQKTLRFLQVKHTLDLSLFLLLSAVAASLGNNERHRLAFICFMAQTFSSRLNNKI